MIYLVTAQTSLFQSELYTIIDASTSLSIMKDWDIVMADSETSGKDPHLNSLLTFQFGNETADIQIVIDCTTIDITLYKNFLETHFLIFHNGKFDLQFLYNYNIVPRKIYDTMIVEQLLYLGFPKANVEGGIGYSLQALAERYLGIYLDKSVRGEIIWRGLDDQVILYAAKDVTLLEQIMWKQVAICKERKCVEGAKLECNVVPAMAYMEWCGIKLDEEKWKAKMDKDKRNLEESLRELNEYCINHPLLKRFVYIDLQGDLFEGFSTEPKWSIDWQKDEAKQVFKILGFNLNTVSKTTKQSAESVQEKVLKTQKGIDDKFLSLYFNYQGYYKVCTSFGQGHLNSINPLTGRLHTIFWQLGASSGRMSCGGGSNEDLARYKKISGSDCPNVNLQQLPSDEDTRSAFVAPKGHLFVSADFSAEESRLAADIYQDEEFLKEFLERSGDMHSLFAWTVFRKECQELGCTSVSDVKSKAPNWRKAVKAVEFAYLFGAEAVTISQNANCSVEQAQKYLDDMNSEFSGVSSFAKKGAYFVRNNGYIVINPITGHRLWWYNWKQWKERQATFSQEGFWDEYKTVHKGSSDYVATMVRDHFREASKYDRLARNVVTQGTGAIILKASLTELFNWIIDNDYFGKIHICAAVHDEINCDYPEELSNFPQILESIMEKNAAKYCKSLPIPAEASISNHWVH